MSDAGPYLLVAVLLVFPLVQIIAMAEDARRMTISNRLPLILVVGFGLFVILSAPPLTEVYFRIGLGAGLLAVGTVGFARGMIGGGDVKLLAASAPWISPIDAALFLFIMAMSGGTIAIAAYAYRYLQLPPPFGWSWLDHTEDHQGIPYALAIGIAGLWAFSASKTFQPVWSML